MENPFKNNSLASGLLGVIIGGASVLGFEHLNTPNHPTSQPVMGIMDNTNSSGPVLPQDNPKFHGLENDSEGDVVITPSGGCYHSPYGCSSLNRSHNKRTVKREDADNAGLTPCSKCNP